VARKKSRTHDEKLLLDRLNPGAGNLSFLEGHKMEKNKGDEPRFRKLGKRVVEGKEAIWEE